jgi:phage protein D
MPQQKPKLYLATISIDGTPLSTAILDKLLEIQVDTSLGMPDMAMFSFADDNTALMDSETFKPGKAVEIKFQPPDPSNTFTVVMKGEITSLEPAFVDNTITLVVRAYDKTHRLTRETKYKAWRNVTDSDVVSQLASEAGLTAVVGTTTTVRKAVIQDNVTPIRLLQMLAQRNGFVLQFSNNTLTFKAPSSFTTSAGTVEFGKQLLEFRPRLNLAGQVTQVQAKGWDPTAKQAIVGSNSAPSPLSTIGSAGTGSTQSNAAFSAAKQTVVGIRIDAQSDADAIAKATHERINNQHITAEGLCAGDPNIVAGKKLTISKVGTRFSGTYFITSAVHRYRAGAYHTEFAVEGASYPSVVDLMSAGPAVSNNTGGQWLGLFPAVVTNNLDSSEGNKGRVKVKFPWLDDQVESHWARVVVPGSGSNRGMLLYPEVNDEVLVGFEAGDFNRPYVLGGLWNGQDAPPIADSTVIQNGKVTRRGLVTRLGYCLLFVEEDATKTITLADAVTSPKLKLVLDITNKKITIENTEGDIDVKSKGKTSITATGNVEVNTQGSMTLKATQNINIEATGQLVLKGSVVNIN